MIKLLTTRFHFALLMVSASGCAAWNCVENAVLEITGVNRAIDEYYFPDEVPERDEIVPSAADLELESK
jgi:hypothetical protein